MYGGSDVIDPYHSHFTVTLNLKQAKNILVILTWTFCSLTNIGRNVFLKIANMEKSNKIYIVKKWKIKQN